MVELSFATDTMAYPTRRPTHIVKGFVAEHVDEQGHGFNFVGNYLCGSKGLIVTRESNISSWYQVEEYLDGKHDINKIYCEDCLKQASFLLMSE